MFTNDELKALIRKEMIGDIYPYLEKNDEAVQNFIKQLIAELNRNNILCKLESEHFGSGYASYRQLLCYEKGNLEVTKHQNTYVEHIKGLHVLVSTLAPVAIIGVGQQSTEYTNDTNKFVSAGGSMLDVLSQLDIPESLKALQDNLERLLMTYNLTILRKEYVEQPLPFKASIPTLSRFDGDYLVWDAIFYWLD